MVQHAQLFAGEFAGTMVLVVVGGGAGACSTLRYSKGADLNLAAQAAAWGLGLTLGCTVSEGNSPGHLNPAITLAAFLFDTVTVLEALIAVCAQFLGAFIGAVLVYLVYYPLWGHQTEPVLGIFATVPAVRTDRFMSYLAAETIGTTLLMFAVKTAGDVYPADGLRYWVIGMALCVAVLALGGPTGCALNPARDLSPRLAHCLLPIPRKGSSDWSYSWVPVLGPIAGASIGTSLYNHAYSNQTPAGMALIAFLLVIILAGCLIARHED